MKAITVEPHIPGTARLEEIPEFHGNREGPLDHDRRERPTPHMATIFLRRSVKPEVRIIDG